jgi:hypothetical protein
MTFQQDELPPMPDANRSDAEIALIASVLRNHLPLQCELVGRANVVEVSRGSEFAEPLGGHRLDFTAMLNSLSSIATVIQFCALAAGWAIAKARKSEAAHAAQPATVLSAAIHQRFNNDPRVRAALQEDPALIDKIVNDVLARLASAPDPGPTS